jgi:hypothetical protein
MDEYIPFIIILINRYINHFKFDKILEIKSYTYFEKYERTHTQYESLPCTGLQCNETLAFSSKEKDKITLGKKQNFFPNETTHTTYVSDEMKKTDSVILFHYDSRNSALLYNYDIIKVASQITFDNLIDILYNLFRTKLIYHR